VEAEEEVRTGEVMAARHTYDYAYEVYAADTGKSVVFSTLKAAKKFAELHPHRVVEISRVWLSQGKIRRTARRKHYTRRRRY
jgi:hypothetical protein